MKKNYYIRYFTFFFLAAALLNTGIVSGQKLKSGPQDLSFFSSVDETDQPYAVYIPENFDQSKEYPLVIFLHGAISNHRLGLRRAFGQGNIQGPDFMTPGFSPVQTDLEVTRYYPVLKDVDYIVAAPYARGTAGYQGIPEQDVYEMLDDLKSRFRIDEDRIYLTGLSMGGGGTIWLGLTRPDIWAALAPCCPAPPDGTLDLSCNAGNLPVHLFIGDRDGLYETAQTWRKEFTENASLFDYVEYPGISHNSWEYAYKDGFIFDWFSQFERDLYPQHVEFRTEWYKYNKAYWVTMDKLTPGTPANIDAEFTGVNAIGISTSSLDAFTLNLAGHPQFDMGKRVRISVDGKTFTVKTPDAVSFIKENGTWVNRKYTPGLHSKQKGAEGPLYAAVESNHVYVYGTGGDPSPEEQEARRAQAAAAADWAADRGFLGRIMVFPRVLSDEQVRQSDLETSNLILFGTRETNSVIERFADKLPLHLNPDAGEYGLVYIYPMNGHYILINSGLPWWTPPAEAPEARGMSFMGLKAEDLRNYRDFILFKDTPDNAVSQGSFDHEWSLPADEASGMMSTGVIEMNE